MGCVTSKPPPPGEETSSTGLLPSLKLDLRGNLVDALRDELKAEVIEKLQSEWREQVKAELHKQVADELLASLRTELRGEVAATLSRLPHVGSSPSGEEKDPILPDQLMQPRTRGRRSSILDRSAEVSWAASLIRNATGPNEQTALRTQMVLFTDLGGAVHDCGDTVALFLLRGLEGLGFIKAKAVIVSSGPHTSARPRQLDASVKTVTQVLNNLRFDKTVPVGVCLGTSSAETLPDEYNIAPNVHLAEDVLKDTCVAADDGALALVLTTITTTFAIFLQRYGDLCSKKLRHVSILGQVSPLGFEL